MRYDQHFFSMVDRAPTLRSSHLHPTMCLQPPVSQVQTLCCAGHDGIYVLGAENGSLQLWQRDGSVDI